MNIIHYLITLALKCSMSNSLDPKRGFDRNKSNPANDALQCIGLVPLVQICFSSSVFFCLHKIAMSVTHVTLRLHLAACFVAALGLMKWRS